MTVALLFDIRFLLMLKYVSFFPHNLPILAVLRENYYQLIFFFLQRSPLGLSFFNNDNVSSELQAAAPIF